MESKRVHPKLASALQIENGPFIPRKPPHRIAPPGKINMRNAAVAYLVFFFSGTAALIYQVSWSRQLGLLFGHTVQAAAVVLASYFAGMAAGYWMGAKSSSRIHPLLGYGMAELVVAGWGILIPTLIGCTESSAIGGLLSHSSFGLQILVRAVFAFLLLLPATTALGATLPMMTEFLAMERRRDATDAGYLSLAYALNTAGALVGILSSTFVLLVVVGVRNSSYFAAGISLLCAVTAWMLARWSSSAVDCHAKYLGATGYTSYSTDSGDSNSQLPSMGYRLSLVWSSLAALSGFSILALEVLYAHMFSLVFHNSTYTLGAVVAVIVASLAVGAALVASLHRRHCVGNLVAWVAGSGALAVPWSVLAFVSLTNLDYYTCGDSFFRYLAGAFLLVVFVIAPPITLLGMILPLLWTALAAGQRAGFIVGRLSAVSMISGALGALASSFFLLPSIGLWPSFALIGLLLYLVAFFLLYRSGRPTPAIIGAVVFGCLALLVLRSPLEAPRSDEHLVRRWNSAYGWIDLVRHEKTGNFKVRQNLHYRFGGTGDDTREHLQAHLPLLLHERPQDVLFLGLGTGLTAGAAIPHAEVENIVVVELVPEVIEAAGSLRDHNRNVVHHPKVSVRVDDARHYLHACERRFDAIVSDLFVPWEAETGYLYTVEHYRVAKQRLKPGGLFCQWVPVYQVGAREFELIADSFANVFGVSTLWWGELSAAKPVIALIGSDQPIELDADRLQTRLAALRMVSSDDIPETAERLHFAYLGDWLPRSSSRLNTDEHPRVEFLTPISERDHQMLAGFVLRDYYDTTLSRLPATKAQLHRAVGLTLEPAEQRRAWQRFILFGDSASAKAIDHEIKQ